MNVPAAKTARVPSIQWAALVGGVAMSLVGVLFLCTPLGGGLERWSYDIPFQFISLDPAADLAIVYIDEASHGELDQRFNSAWDRKLHSRLVRRLTEDHAKVIFFDFAFSDSEPEKDSEFAAAMRRHGRVFLGATLDGNKLGKLSPTLTNAAAGCGPFYIDRRDALYGVRRLWTGTRDYPSEVWLAAKSISPHLREEERLRERWLHYYGEPGSLPWTSYYRALDTNVIPAGYFSNKFVFVGGHLPVSFVGASKDEFETPYSRFAKSQKLAPGTEIHATAFLNLWATHWLKRFEFLFELTLLILIGFAAGWGLTMLDPLPAVALAVISAVLICAVALLLMLNRLWFSWLLVVALQIPLALAWSITWNAIRVHVEKKLLKESLCRYFSKAQVEHFLQHPELLRPGAREQEVSILFSDITGFSKIAELKTPPDLVRLLNNYYATAIECINATGGTVMDLIGDAIFAIWNAPEEQPDHRERACRAALLLQERLLVFDETERDLPLQTRVGLHTGIVCVGNIGSPTRFDYTAIGDNVNMASRLERLNKSLGTVMLATRDIQKAVENRLVCRLVGHFQFVGLFRPIEVHELIGPQEKQVGTKPWREAFANGLAFFQRNNLDAAEREFLRVLELRYDGPAKYYLDLIRKLRTTPRPADWKGEIDLNETRHFR